MAFTLVAPYPLVQTTTVLPNPQFGNSEAAAGTIDIKRTVTGKRRTYVKSRDGRRKLSWTFTLTRNKALELLEFYRAYHAQNIFIDDHEGRRWEGNITNNPFEIEMSRRGLPSLQGWPVGETCSATMEFEGFRTDATLEEENFSRIHGADASSELLLLRQSLALETPLTVTAGLQNNWDATEITGVSNGGILNTWFDSGPAGNDLIGRIGGVFNPTIDRSPTYLEASPIFNDRPTVQFSNVQNQQGSTTASMLTTSNMSLFPARRGTIFWVMTTIGGDAYAFYELATKYPHLYDPDLAQEQLALALESAPICDANSQSATEFGVWALQDTAGGAIVEQFHMAGASSPFAPCNIRFQPVDVANDIRLIRVEEGPQDPGVGTSNSVCALDPNIYMMQRDTDTNLRFRTNGIEREGATILNNPGRFGKFYVNDQAWIPQFNAKVRGEWGQILVYNRALNATEIAQVENYLSLRWGIPLGQVEF